jgi:hypothetical protein
MNNQTPFLLYKTNRHEFLTKTCAICWNTLFLPEANSNKMVHCCKLECDHMFHNNCINQSINSNNLSCPECRKTIDTNKMKNMDKSLELAIRDDAFNHNEIDDVLREQFANSCLTVEDYPYHKLVFKRWLSAAKTK